MASMCGDNRFEVIEKAKEALLKDSNIESSPKEMEVLDNFLFRAWQMGWLKQYDTPTETDYKERMKEEFLTLNEREEKVKFTFDDVLAIQCCMETVKKVQEDEALYAKLSELHSKLYDACH